MQQIFTSAVPICQSSRQDMEGIRKVEMRDNKLSQRLYLASICLVGRTGKSAILLGLGLGLATHLLFLSHL